MAFTTQEFWQWVFNSGLATQLFLLIAFIVFVGYMVWRGDAPRRERLVRSQESIATAVTLFAEREQHHGKNIEMLTHEVRSGFQSLNVRFDTLPDALQKQLVPHIAEALAERMARGMALAPPRKTFLDILLGR